MDGITYPFWELSQTMLVKAATGELYDSQESNITHNDLVVAVTGVRKV